MAIVSRMDSTGGELLPNVDATDIELSACLKGMARGEDTWEDFFALMGRFILYVLKHDYSFFEEFDEHTREEALHDIYLLAARYAGRFNSASATAYRAYLRRIIATVMSNKRRIYRQWCREVSLESDEWGRHEPKAHTYLNPLTWLEEMWWGKTIEPTVRAAIKEALTRSQHMERNRIILESRLIRGTSYNVIAEQVGISADTARQVVYYFRPRILGGVRRRVGFTGTEE